MSPERPVRWSGASGRSGSPAKPGASARFLCALVASLVPTLAAGAGDAVHLGVATCASSTCHGSAKPAESGNVQRNEYVTWSRFDPHAFAWRTLSGERSQAIARRLGLGPPREAKECLDCHADATPPERRGPKWQLDDGIGCEVCHGGASSWLATHDDFPTVDHTANVAAGMTDLTDPRLRAGVCTGCHVGDDGRGATNRFASHRLMAAGHPRLSFELDTFTELWRASGGREHYRRDPDYAARKSVPAPGSVWAAGLAANARARVQMIGHRYGGALPDFALFNCYSCHRAMRLADWRDSGRDANPDPGSVSFDDSVLTVLDAALAARPGLRTQLAGATARWQAAAERGGAAVTQAGSVLDAVLQEVERDLADHPPLAADARAALAALSEGAGRGAFPDYAAAEQAAMGLAVLVETTGERERHRPAIEALFRALESDERYDARRFARLLSTMRKKVSP